MTNLILYLAAFLGALMMTTAGLMLFAVLSNLGEEPPAQDGDE